MAHSRLVDPLHNLATCVSTVGYFHHIQNKKGFSESVIFSISFLAVKFNVNLTAKLARQRNNQDPQNDEKLI